mgnify:CR=1 FL=1
MHAWWAHSVGTAARMTKSWGWVCAGSADTQTIAAQASTWIWGSGYTTKYWNLVRRSTAQWECSEQLEKEWSMCFYKRKGFVRWVYKSHTEQERGLWASGMERNGGSTNEVIWRVRELPEGREWSSKQCDKLRSTRVRALQVKASKQETTDHCFLLQWFGAADCRHALRETFLPDFN